MVFDFQGLGKIKSLKMIIFYAILFAISFSIALILYKVWYGFDYKAFLNIIFTLQIEFLNLFLIIPFILIFSIPYIFILTFSGVFEAQDGMYAAIITSVITVITSLIIVGFTIPVFMAAFILAISFPVIMGRVRKKLGLFKMRRILWREAYFLFLFISIALAVGLILSFAVDMNENKPLTEDAFLSTPALGFTSGYDALRLQLRAAYVAGFTEGAVYQSGDELSLQERAATQGEAERKSKEILGSEQSAQAIRAYASSFPLFDIMVFLIPVLLSILVFFVSLAILTALVRPFSMLIFSPLYEYMMRLYIRWTF
jgi:hypothetical protein